MEHFNRILFYERNNPDFRARILDGLIKTKTGGIDLRITHHKKVTIIK